MTPRTVRGVSAQEACPSDMITTYAELQTAVADWLNRPTDTELVAAIPTMIQLAEARFKRDPRVRKLQNSGAFNINADGDALPSDFMRLEALYYNGSEVFGPLEIVGPDLIGTLKARCGAGTGRPTHAAVVDDTLLYAPAPDATYAARLIYWRTIEALSASNTSNWLLEQHPDVYFWGTLAESAPYLKDDRRAQLWEAKREAAMNEIHVDTWNEQYGGTLERQFDPIG